MAVCCAWTLANILASSTPSFCCLLNCCKCATEAKVPVHKNPSRHWMKVTSVFVHSRGLADICDNTIPGPEMLVSAIMVSTSNPSYNKNNKNEFGINWWTSLRQHSWMYTINRPNSFLPETIIHINTTRKPLRCWQECRPHLHPPWRGRVEHVTHMGPWKHAKPLELPVSCNWRVPEILGNYKLMRRMGGSHGFL